MRDPAALALVAALALGGGVSAAPSPWDLHCASMPIEQSVPGPLSRAANEFSPWQGAGGVRGLRAGPAYLVAGSFRTAISRDGDSADSSGEYLHRALLAVAPSYAGRVVVTGRRLGGPGMRTTVGFSTDGAARCSVGKLGVVCSSPALRFAPRLTIPRRAGWRVVPTELRIGRTGCFQLTVSGPGLRGAIPLAVPGPDWGTPGW